MSGGGPGGPGPLPPGLSRAELVDEVGRALRPVPIGATAVVAVSGGPDSSAAASLVHEARPDLDLHLAHVRHGLRADEEDVTVVRDLADGLGVPLHVTEVEVRPSGEGTEAAARRARYAALRRVAREVSPQRQAWLVIGHTADDQAETLLLRMARGTGIAGLSGMAPVRGDLVRPLLRVRRNDVRRFVALEGLDAVLDPMNLDPSFRRVRARFEVLPVLEALAPDPVGALGRLADLARADARHLTAEASELAAASTRRYGPCRAVPQDLLATIDRSLARRLVRAVLEEVRGGPPLGAAHVAAVLELEPGQAVDLPGATVTCGGGWVAVAPAELPVGDAVRLAVPGVTNWPPAGLVVTATIPGGSADGQLALGLELPWHPPDPDVPERSVPPGGDTELGQVVLPAGVGELVARPRQPGDRLVTSVGTRKLQDVLVDAGVPRAVRDLVPVVTAGDRIAWIPGVAVDAELAAAARSDPGIHLAVA